MIDGKNFFDQLVKIDMITYSNIRKIATGQEHDYTAARLLDCNYFNIYYETIVIDLSNQEILYADPKHDSI